MTKRRKLKQAAKAAHNWIKNRLHKQGRQYALSKDGDRRFTNMTTNCLENFNNALKGARALPI